MFLFLAFFQLEGDMGIRQMEILKVRFVVNEAMEGHGARASQYLTSALFS